MVRKAIGEQRVRAHVPSGSNAVRNSHCLLPDRPRVGHFEDSRWRVKKLCQIREINMRPHVISAEIMYGIKRSEINLSRDSLPGDRKSTRLNSSHSQISYAVFCLTKTY